MKKKTKSPIKRKLLSFILLNQLHLQTNKIKIVIVSVEYLFREKRVVFLIDGTFSVTSYVQEVHFIFK